jgi:outer membrane protein
MTRLYVIILLLLSPGIYAQDLRKVTIDQAIEMGLTHATQLTIDLAKGQAATAKYQQQLYAAIPTVSINSGYSHLSTNVDEVKLPVQGVLKTVSTTIHDQLANRLSLNQVIFAGMRGWNLIKNNKLQSQATQADMDKDRTEVRLAIITAYYNHYKLSQSLTIVQENITLTDRRLQDVKNMLAAGMALRNDVLKVELALSTLQQTEAEVQSAIDVSGYNLAVMMGLPDNVRVTCEETGMYRAKSSGSRQSYLSESLVQRSDIKAIDYRIAGAARMVKTSKGTYYPVVTGGFNFYFSRPNPRFFFEEEVKFHNSWDIGINLAWNLTQLFTTQYQTHEAKANLAVMTAQRAQLDDNIRMEVNANYNAYKLTLDKISIQQKALAQAKENQTFTKNQVDNGLKTIADLLEADNLAAQTNINLTNSKIDAETAYARLLKATGK